MQELKAVLAQAVEAVEEGRGAVVDAVLDNDETKNVRGTGERSGSGERK